MASDSVPTGCQRVPAGDSPARRGKHHCDKLLAWHLANGMTITRSAALAKLSKRTALRRCRDPEFRDQVAALRALVLDRSRGLLARSQVEALQRLRRLARGDDPKVACAAAGLLARVVLPGKLVTALTMDDQARGERQLELDDVARCERRGLLDIDEDGHARLVDGAGNVLADYGIVDDGGTGIDGNEVTDE